MTAGLDRATGIIFESVMFQGPTVQITYTTPDDRVTDGAVMVRSFLLDAPEKTPAELEEFIDALRNLLEEGLRAKRNPPPQIIPRVEPEVDAPRELDDAPPSHG